MKKLYAERIKRLQDSLPVRKSVVVLTAYSLMQRQGDMASSFAQEPNFLWVSGVGYPEWRVIITPDDVYLVQPESTEVQRIFSGGAHEADAAKQSGVRRILDQAEAEHVLKELSRTYSTVYTLGADPHAEHYDFIENPAPASLRSYLAEIFTHVDDCRPQLQKLRAIKSSDELGLMRAAIKTSIDSFERVRRELPSLSHEYEIEALFNADFRSSGGQGHAYEPIVAAGKNACTLHYVDNNAPLIKDGTVLLDVGARVGGYNTDITRTYATGAPTKRQVAIHAAVEKAHHKIIALIAPGMSLKQYLEEVDEIMKDALEEVHLLKDRADEETYRTYFPHAISHGLGLDVHESLGGYKEFMPGMVLTVEPGIYIPEEGIGVRIEDDILVTKDGHENLSASLPTSL